MFNLTAALACLVSIADFELCFRDVAHNDTFEKKPLLIFTIHSNTVL